MLPDIIRCLPQGETQMRDLVHVSTTTLIIHNSYYRKGYTANRNYELFRVIYN